MACASIMLVQFAGSKLGTAVLLWTVPVIALYAVFVRFNLTLFKKPDGELVNGLQCANILTAVRIFLVPPILVFLFEGALLWGMILYIIAACTDVADGFVARRFDQETEIGVVLDPVGDIVSTAAVFGFLWYREMVPTWLFVILIVRYAQFSVGLIVLAIFGVAPRLSATAAGKVVGVVQAVGIFILLASMVFKELLPYGTIRQYLEPVLGVAFCSVIVSQTVIGWQLVKTRSVRAMNQQGG